MPPMAGAESSSARPHPHSKPSVGNRAAEPLIYQGLPSADPLPDGRPSKASPHSRETSTANAYPPGSSSHSATATALSPHPLREPLPRPSVTSANGARAALSQEHALERRPSYGHHRQTSIVHGLQHSRNASFANSPATSPLGSEVFDVGTGARVDVLETSPSIAPSEYAEMLPNAMPSSILDSRPSHKTTSLPLGGADGHVSDGGSSTVLAQRKVDRMHSGKPRRDQSHHHSSHSRHNHQHAELKTVGEYALHHLFNSFIGQADDKIDQCTASISDPEPRVEDLCGPGVDPSFDQLISALGHVARQKPKPLIDTLMFWRKAKADSANAARLESNQQKGIVARNIPPMPRRNTEPLHILADPPNPSPNATSPSPSSAPASRHDVVTQAERRSTVSIYLLCRVLIEIIGQSSLASVTPEMADRLEDIIFGQLKAADPDQIATSPLRMANWSIFSHLLGVMSDISFSSVSERFLKELEKLHRDWDARGGLVRETESRMQLMIMGMKHLRVKTHSEESWNQTCDFMLRLGRFFANSHGQRIKHTYCQILEKLLLPIAAAPSADLNTPKWRAVLEIIGPRVSQMVLKPRHWLEAFPVLAILPCVSTTESFLNQWMQIISPLQSKLKDRTTRGTALRAIARLLWTYLYRPADPAGATAKKLEEIVRLILPPGRKSYLSTDPAVSEPMIQIMRIIGYKHQELCFKTMIFPVINSEYLTSGKELKVDQLEPEKIVIGIRAFLVTISDLERGPLGRPPFPDSFSNGLAIDRDLSAFSGPAPKLLTDPKGFKVREERLSQPVLIQGLGEVAKDYYARFCAILGIITMICDDAFGGQAVLDEKFSSSTPKTPIAETFSFSRKDEHQTMTDQKQGYYDLFHVAVQALPRCLSADIPFNALVNLLCTGTAHVQSQIAFSSAQSLKSIARQSFAQQVTVGFARFIFNFDDRYSTMSDGGMLGPGHIENTLKLYVELVQIWIDQIKQKSKDVSSEPLDENVSANRGLQLDQNSVWAYVDEIESHGLFFLCSQSRRVRSFAVTVLRLITEFDTALGKGNTRIIHVMENESLAVMDFNDEQLSVAERSRLQRGLRKSNSQDTLIELCGSDISYDSTLWFKIFPNLIRISFERCPFATTLGRELVSVRLFQMQRTISAMSETQRGPQSFTYDAAAGRQISRPTTNPPEVIIEQWKLYLIVTCTTLTNAGSQQTFTVPNTQYVRRGSKTAQQGQEKIGSAKSLFQYVIELLSVSPSSIREAVVVALGSINLNLYKILLESLASAVNRCNDEARQRIHQRTVSSPRRNNRMDRLRTEITHVYKLTSHFLRDESVYTDDWILHNLVTYTNDLKIFLSDAEVQNDWEFQKLRRHYCGLLEELFEGINRTKDPARWMSFEARKSAFHLMEDWCGYSPNQNQIREREDSMRQSLVDQQKELGDRRVVTAAMEIEKRNLKTAALSAMAALCGGPVSLKTERKATLQFDVRRMLSWVEAIFSTPSDRMHAIGRRALTNLITHNMEQPYLLERSVQMCYQAGSPKALESYVDVVTQVLLKNENSPVPFWKILGAILFILGNEKSELRSKSLQLLRTLEERRHKSSKIQDYDISISDKTTAVYKLAQFEISKRLAKQHSELAFHIFSEFTCYFKTVEPKDQRNMVATILPWIQTVELQVDPNGGPTANSYMLLANLFEITISSGGSLHNEVQALWQALATGPHAGNVQFVLDFVISLCLDKREQNFVDYAKQIVVFLSSTPAGLKVVEFLILQVNPKAMVQQKPRALIPPPEALSLPYLADLSLVLPVGNKQTRFSLGHLSLILLVDLMVSPVQLPVDSVTLLLQVVFVLWDHYIPLVQDQAREMLIHLIHELVISKIDQEDTVPTKKSIEDLIEAIRRDDSSVVWDYDDGSLREEENGRRVLKSMEYLGGEVINVFALTYPGIRESWGKTTLNWATSCTVRHLACRSFQIFRCILSSLDESMLADMLARLSNTIAAEEIDVQTFSMEILTTLKTIIAALSPSDILKYPQLFWTTCACLNTTHESEFIESLAMLELFIHKVDLSDPEVIRLLSDNLPAKWEGAFEGLQPLIYRGLRSDLAINQTLVILGRLSYLPQNSLIGDENRLVFSILANLPRFLQSMDEDIPDPACIASAESLANCADDLGFASMSRVLRAFAETRYRTSNDFLIQSASAIRESYFPEWDFQSLKFLMGLLTNRLAWFKIRTMQLLCVLIPDIDMRKPEIASHGPDLISPLLRLLQTEFCPQALEVLDYVMAMPGTPMDKHHLRMSMVDSHSRAIRKEYERTESLFGIPEESGWSIPMPAIHAAATRANVHSVFYTCANPESMKAGIAATPDLEFHADDFNYGFPFPDRTGTMMSDDVRGEGNMADLVMKLDHLDDFFEDDDTRLQNPDFKGSSRLGSLSEESSDPGERYDQQTLPLLRQSLARTGSVTSFQTGFPDTKTSSTRDRAIMSPTAFAPPTRALPRPRLHSRSVTSPAPNQGQTSMGMEFFSDSDMSDIHSEDETRTAGSQRSRNGTFSLGDVIRPVTQSTRAGMRRLTGTVRDKDKHRENGRSEKKAVTQSPSPKVPKVPDIYLQNPPS
ncbi:MAG: Cell morphogenesis protein PAG1 [Sclerophora amabilis]|nr:MAG: Cell morphogenesis protein PAG1 [Sclerophora amabilis]